MRNPTRSENSRSSSSDTLSAPGPAQAATTRSRPAWRRGRGRARSAPPGSWRGRSVGARAAAAGSHPRRTCARPRPARPTENDASAQRNEPMCDIDEPGRNTSSGVSSNASAALAHIQPSVSRLCVTPLAGPGAPRREEDRRRVGGRGRRRSRRARFRRGQLLERRRVADRPSSVIIAERQRAGELARGEVVGPFGVRDDRAARRSPRARGRSPAARSGSSTASSRSPPRKHAR